jgi:transposase
MPMPRRVIVTPHLSVADLEARYRQAHDPVARSHWQIVWLLAQGKRVGEVAAVTGYSAKWGGSIAGRYHRDGPTSLGDRRHANPGGRPVLSPTQQAALTTALAWRARPPDGGVWTGPQVAAWIEQQPGRAVGPQCGWSYLRRLGGRRRRPRPRHAKADPAAQEAFTKGA